MENSNFMEPTKAQLEILNLFNTTDSPDIAVALKKVFNMALFDNSNTLNDSDKDDLFILDKIISITQNINP